MRLGTWVAGFLTVYVACVQALPLSDSESARMFAIVIGLNQSVEANVAALRYADDDAVQNAQLMNQLGAQVILLTELDRDTKRLYPPLLASQPTRGAVSKALQKLNRQIDRVHATGGKTILFVFYSGHGDVKNNQGYLSLVDQPLWRDDLLELLRQSRATVNHLIIDACKSYYAVFERGASGSRRPLRSALVSETSSLRSNTGVFLSTSSAADSHEWEALQAGIFSHELRSALRGAADVDLDGKLTYAETGAFIWAANAEIKNAKFRPAFFSKPPAEADDLLLNLGQVQADRLHIGAGMKEHLFVEDHLGRRLVDIHPSASQAVVLHLPRKRPLFVRQANDQKEWELPKGSQLHLGRLRARSPKVRRRGAQHVAFQKLFRRPFGPASLPAYAKWVQTVALTQEGESDYRALRYGVGISSALLAIAGGTMTAMALIEKDDVSARTSGLERHRINTRISNYNTAAVICYSLAATALTSFLAWTFWPTQEVEVQIMPANQVGLQMKLTF